MNFQTIKEALSEMKNEDIMLIVVGTIVIFLIAIGYI